MSWRRDSFKERGGREMWGGKMEERNESGERKNGSGKEREKNISEVVMKSSKCV